MDSLTLRIGGKNRHVSPEVLLKQAANALRGISLPSGDYDLVIDREGSVWLDGEKVFTPSRPQIAAKAKVA